MRYKDRELQYQEWRDTKEETPKIKTNIKIRVNPEQSKKVQEIYFANGICWTGSRNYEVKLTNDYLAIDKKYIYFAPISSFDEEEFEEMDADLFIRTNGTCIENPNEHLDRLDDIVDEAIKEIDTSKNNGGKTDYYQLENAPFKINDFDDFAEWRGLNGNQFNMGKVMWTFNVGRHSATDYERELNKIQHYLDREKLRISRLKKA